MIARNELDELHWYERGDLNCWCFKTSGYFICLKTPAQNITRHFFEIETNGHIMYVGNIPDKNAMVSLMRWLEFPQYDSAGDPWNSEPEKNS